MRAGKEESWLTPTGPVEGYVDNIFWSASLGVARFRKRYDSAP